MDPGTAFQHPASCKNLAGLPTAERGENVAWRIWWPRDWSAQESLTGECMWFGPEPWQSDIDRSIPPDAAVIVISVLDGRVTPTSSEFEGGSITREERFTVAGVPAVRYEISESHGQLLDGDGVIWVVGTEGELPRFEGGFVLNYISIFTSSPATERLVEQVDVLDRMVATLELLP